MLLGSCAASPVLHGLSLRALGLALSPWGWCSLQQILLGHAVCTDPRQALHVGTRPLLSSILLLPSLDRMAADDGRFVAFTQPHPAACSRCAGRPSWSLRDLKVSLGPSVGQAQAWQQSFVALFQKVVLCLSCCQGSVPSACPRHP